MQVADNHPPIDAETIESHNGATPEPDTIDDKAEAGSSDHLAGDRVIGIPFQPGNQLWRKRKPPGLQSSRRSLREALHEALTPDRMRAAVERMLLIVHGKDNKASVQAFKVLAEAAGVRGDGDSARSGPSFTFILPGAGAIPISGAALPVLDAEPVDVAEGGATAVETRTEPNEA